MWSRKLTCPKLALHSTHASLGQERSGPTYMQSKIDCESFPSFPPTSSFLLPDTHSATSSHVGHLSFTFSGTYVPYVFLEVMRLSVMGSSVPSNVMHPPGTIAINPAACEITSSSSEQDFIISPQPCQVLQQVHRIFLHYLLHLGWHRMAW